MAYDHVSEATAEEIARRVICEAWDVYTRLGLNTAGKLEALRIIGDQAAVLERIESAEVVG